MINFLDWEFSSRTMRLGTEFDYIQIGDSLKLFQIETIYTFKRTLFNPFGKVEMHYRFIGDKTDTTIQALTLYQAKQTFKDMYRKKIS